MKIQIMTIYVDDQAKALRFYTRSAGLQEEGRLFERGLSLADGLPRPRRPTARSCSSKPTPTRRRAPTSKRGFSRASPRRCSSSTTCSPNTTASRAWA